MVFMRLVIQKPMVTAGLKCAPEMWLKARERTATAIPEASAVASRPVPLLCRKRSVQMAPAPKKTRAKVPRNSATSFCVVVYNGVSRDKRQNGRLDFSWSGARALQD